MYKCDFLLLHTNAIQIDPPTEYELKKIIKCLSRPERKTCNSKTEIFVHKSKEKGRFQHVFISAGKSSCIFLLLLYLQTFMKWIILLQIKHITLIIWTNSRPLPWTMHFYLWPVGTKNTRRRGQNTSNSFVVTHFYICLTRFMMCVSVVLL